jgi:hypothetical protein
MFNELAYVLLKHVAVGQWQNNRITILRSRVRNQLPPAQGGKNGGKQFKKSIMLLLLICKE